MKIYYVTLLLLLPLLTLTSCLEETEPANQVPFSLPVNPVEMTNASRISAVELQDAQFSMATIILTNAAGEDMQFEMPSCLLSVLEASCVDNPECPAEIEEAGATYTFGNSIQPDATDPELNTILFSKLTDPVSQGGEFEVWIEENVYPLIADYPLEVERGNTNNNLVRLSCQDCPIDYAGQQFVKREIIMTADF